MANRGGGLGVIRPEALGTLARWREPGFGAALGALGIWVSVQGGPILAALGLLLGAVGLGLVVTGLRRLRFAQKVASPGIVELVEGELRYFSPDFGGSISLADLAELRLITLRERRMWRFKQVDGQVLLVPVDAAGAEALYDGFTSLPGMDMATALAALAPAPASATPPDIVLIWQRKAAGFVA